MTPKKVIHMTHYCEVFWGIFLSFLRRYSRFCIVGYRLFSRYDLYIYLKRVRGGRDSGYIGQVEGNVKRLMILFVYIDNLVSRESTLLARRQILLKGLK